MLPISATNLMAPIQERLAAEAAKRGMTAVPLRGSAPPAAGVPPMPGQAGAAKLPPLGSPEREAMTETISAVAPQEQRQSKLDKILPWALGGAAFLSTLGKDGLGLPGAAARGFAGGYFGQKLDNALKIKQSKMDQEKLLQEQAFQAWDSLKDIDMESVRSSGKMSEAQMKQLEELQTKFEEALSPSSPDGKLISPQEAAMLVTYARAAQGAALAARRIQGDSEAEAGGRRKWLETQGMGRAAGLSDAEIQAGAFGVPAPDLGSGARVGVEKLLKEREDRARRQQQLQIAQARLAQMKNGMDARLWQAISNMMMNAIIYGGATAQEAELQALAATGGASGILGQRPQTGAAVPGAAGGGPREIVLPSGGKARVIQTPNR